MNTQDQLREIVSDLDLWLGRLYNDLLSLQKDLLKAKGSKTDEQTKKSLAVPVDALTSTVSQLRLYLEDQKESIAILRRSPPGFTSSIIDFLYNVTVDKSAPSQKKTYFDKLKNLDRNVNKEIETIGSALGVPEFAVENKIREQVRSNMADWSQGTTQPLLKLDFRLGAPKAQELEDELTRRSKYIVEAMLRSGAPAALQHELKNLVQTLLTAFEKSSSQLVNDELRKFTSSLRDRLNEVVKQDHQANLERGFQQIDQVVGKKEEPLKTSSLKLGQLASLKDFANRLQTHGIKLQRAINDAKQEKFTHRLNNVLGTLSESADSKEVYLVQKYASFIQALLNPHNKNSVYGYLMQIESSLKNLIETISKSELPSPEVKTLELKEVPPQSPEEQESSLQSEPPQNS